MDLSVTRRNTLLRDECMKYRKLWTFPMSLVTGGGRISNITRCGSESIMICGEGRLDCNTGSGSISSVTPHGQIVFTVTCGWTTSSVTRVWSLSNVVLGELQLSSVARVAKVSSVTQGECIKYGAGQFRELHSASPSNVERSGRLLSVACDDSVSVSRVTSFSSITPCLFLFLNRDTCKWLSSS